MREFSVGQRRFILKHQSDRTLEQLAQRLKCSWEDVYDCYSMMIDSGEYREYMLEKKREKEEKRRKREQVKLLVVKENDNGR